MEKKKGRIDRKMHTENMLTQNFRQEVSLWNLGTWFHRTMATLKDGPPAVPQKTLPLPGILHLPANAIPPISVVLFSQNKAESQIVKDSLFKLFCVNF